MSCGSTGSGSLAIGVCHLLHSGGSNANGRTNLCSQDGSLGIDRTDIDQNAGDKSEASISISILSQCDHVVGTRCIVIMCVSV